MIDSYTNSALSCFRRCPREFELRYFQQLKQAGDDPETLQVGQTWHKAHDAATRAAQDLNDATPSDMHAYETIAKHAPSPAWNEKLRRLFVTYRWRWNDYPLEIIHSEHTFSYELNGTTRRGQIDGIVKVDGAIGLLERKTTSEDLSDGSSFWQRQRMGSQVSFYANAFKQLTGKPPAFVLYDVVRKPTIRPKGITKKDTARLREEIESKEVAEYCGESFLREATEVALFMGRETLEFYGARLAVDIVERPDWYFGRKMIPRTTKDLVCSEKDTTHTIARINNTSFYPRNPDACMPFGRLCDFFGLCSNNEHPISNIVPDGFIRRDHLHPELEETSE